MAPRKAKSQGKKNPIKIKSKNKIFIQKRGSQQKKRHNAGRKSVDQLLENLKWSDKIYDPEESSESQHTHDYYNKQNGSDSSLDQYVYPDLNQKNNDDNKSTTDSEQSEECKCSQSRQLSEENKCGILKNKISSTNSVVAKYIKSGMDHVASFIVESAIRFGKEHGVVVPDKNIPDVYEITSPGNKSEDKFRKIRFKIPGKSVKSPKNQKKYGNNNNAKDLANKSESSLEENWNPRKTPSWESNAESIDEILPLLEKLKQGGNGMVNSDLDITKLTSYSDTDNKSKKEKMREKMKAIGKRYKSVAPILRRGSDEREFNTASWRKFRRDSLELGRHRLRPRKQDSLSPSPY